MADGKIMAGLGVALLAGGAGAQVVVNEVSGSTPGPDGEFIELFNEGLEAVDIGGWSITLYESDATASFGQTDGGSPYVIEAGAVIGRRGYFTLGNATAEESFGFVADQRLPESAIENSSYTLVLRDAAGAVVTTIFVHDGGAADAANIAGERITPDVVVGPDGGFLPSGFYRPGDEGGAYGIYPFDDLPGLVTPGAKNIGGPCPADFDRNGKADVYDLLAYLGAHRRGDASADLDWDGVVGHLDLLEYLGAYRVGCPA